VRGPSEDLDIAGRRIEKAHGKVEEGCLASAVGTDERNHVPRRNPKVAFREGRSCTVPLGQGGGLQGSAHAMPTLSAISWSVVDTIARMLSVSKPASLAERTHRSRLRRSAA